jgi:YcxB-like protein
MRQMFRASPFVKGEWVLTINHEGIAATYPDVITRYQWRAFSQFREMEGLFVLFISPYRVGCWIPKKAMSAEQIDELRQILEDTTATALVRPTSGACLVLVVPLPIPLHSLQPRRVPVI